MFIMLMCMLIFTLTNMWRRFRIFFFLLKNCREDLRLQEEFDDKLHHRAYSTVTIPSILRRKRIINPIGNSLTHSLTHSGREHQIT
jgi:hypothetical protein